MSIILHHPVAVIVLAIVGTSCIVEIVEAFRGNR